jgi:phosphoheptose isomerase
VSAVTDLAPARAHLAALTSAAAALEDDIGTLERWGRTLAHRLLEGGRLLAAGNGGSAAEAQHLTAELVGRFVDDRTPLAAIALHADTSTLSALGNDFGFEEVYARQVRAHGRPGDVLLLLSTSGRSANLLRAADAARETRMVTWGLTGRAPNPLADLCDEAVCVDCDAGATAQELHLVAVHLLCAAVDRYVARRTA